MKKKVLMAASVASMIDQFNMPNIRLLLDMGYEVHVACNFKKGNTCDTNRVQEFEDILRQLGVVCHQWDCTRNICSAGEFIKAYYQLRHIISCRFAWVHCHSPVGGALVRLAAHRAGIPVVYTAHGFHFYRGAPLKNWLLYYPAEKLLAHWTDVLLTVNKEDYYFAKKHLQAGKVCYIPGVGIDVRKFHRNGGIQLCTRKTFCRKYQIPENARIILSVGELSRRKNHNAVLSALAEIPRQDVYYMICGQGEYEKALRRQAEKLGIAQRIRLTGYEKNVEELYQNADLFVFPSLQEGMPVALMEAMAAGLACVVSDVRGNRELIDQGDAAFQLRHPGQLKKKLVMFLEDEKKRTAYGRYNAEKIRRYSLPAVQKRMKRIYRYSCLLQNRNQTDKAGSRIDWAKRQES